ncbi:hypothetical protein AO065_10090 [Pseudomonas viridiflava]|nr:hypothetical protein AAI_00882 [Pseudomonas viridiflava UASWS0038]KPL65742.1 hypothetical protein PVFL_04920 [Pseudomonas viridiflava]OAG83133.1 hypothetical protein AO065_10090 [Pseudomonas viridiflava]
MKRLRANLPERLRQVVPFNNLALHASAPAVTATFGGLCGYGLLCILISLLAYWPDSFFRLAPEANPMISI